MVDWQSIETYPIDEMKSGPEVLVVVSDEHGPVLLIGQLEAGGWIGRSPGDVREFEFLPATPTYWMPLPDLPKS